MERFRYWCYKVLPLIYDDSLSYYEVLCKVVKYINDLIAQDKIIGDDITALQQDMRAVQTWIDNFDTSYAENIIRETIGQMILVEISDAGYIVYNIPDSWADITFRTTGLDIELDLQPEYGHLVLEY